MSARTFGKRSPRNKKEVPDTLTFTITYGEVAENHIGQQQIGTDSSVNIQRGLSKNQLLNIQGYFDDLGAETELVDLTQWTVGTEIEGSDELWDACVLVAKNGASFILETTGRSADDMLEELKSLEWDSKFYSKKHGKVVNKNARSNLCFDDESQEADYEQGKGTIVSFESVPCVKMIRETLVDLAYSPETDLRDGALKAEGNRYTGGQGIGFHGDTERKIVMAVRLGDPIPLQYQWFFGGNPVGDRIELNLEHGDIYFMSEKAVGNDWKRRIIPTLRHAAGSPKYTTIKEKKEGASEKSSEKPTYPEGSVKNPKTGRTIKIGAGVFKTLIAEGYVLSNGELVLKNSGV